MGQTSRQGFLFPNFFQKKLLPCVWGRGPGVEPEKTEHLPTVGGVAWHQSMPSTKNPAKTGAGNSRTRESEIRETKNFTEWIQIIICDPTRFTLVIKAVNGLPTVFKNDTETLLYFIFINHIDVDWRTVWLCHRLQNIFTRPRGLWSLSLHACVRIHSGICVLLRDSRIFFVRFSLQFHSILHL